MTMPYAIKVRVTDPDAAQWVFDDQKTMYGGRRVQAGDTIFVIDSEHEGGCGLVARGRVTAAAPIPATPGLARQTPRVRITVAAVARSRLPLGRAALKPFSDWGDGRPETELNFKLVRQATNKIVGLTDAAAAFLASHF